LVCGSELKFISDETDDADDEDLAAENTVHSAFGFLFALGVLSFTDAKLRAASVIDYQERDEFTQRLTGVPRR
jgi:hypothetical protein